MAGILFSSAPESLPLAMVELQQAFGPRAQVHRLGPDLGTFTAPDVTVGAVARRCREHPVAFVKHLTVEVARFAARADLSLVEVGAAAADAVGLQPAGTAIAVQAWLTAPGPVSFSPAEAAGAIGDALRDRGLVPARAGQDLVISCCLAGPQVLIGLNKTRDSIADWPGGRVRLSRPAEQVSRSEFKLEELLQSGELVLPAAGTAVDLGAAPGGWTRILRHAGLRVTAVDPGDLDPSLYRDGRIRHERTTAMEYLRSGPKPFDVVVNDMRMDPVRSAETMVEAARRLRPGGLGVLTLKTGTSRVLATLDRALGVLASAYQVELVRQLQHNRHEVTAVLRRR